MFKKNVEDALSARNIVAPLHILKADGGSLPIEHMVSRPVETAFTGPAATVLGLSALGVIGNQHTVALDIGGTTTDISLWKHGRPLMTKNGVSIREYPSAVRSFAVTSVGIGGESVVRFKNGNLTVGPERVGPSVALGGIEPTLGDALIVLGHANYGDFNLASRALQDLADAIQATLQSNNVNTLNNQLTLIKTSSDVARLILQNALETIQRGVDEVITVENKRPIYVVADIVNPDIFVPEHIVVVGGTAQVSERALENIWIYLLRFQKCSRSECYWCCASPIYHRTHCPCRYKRRLLVIPELGIKQQIVL